MTRHTPSPTSALPAHKKGASETSEAPIQETQNYSDSVPDDVREPNSASNRNKPLPSSPANTS